MRWIMVLALAGAGCKQAPVAASADDGETDAAVDTDTEVIVDTQTDTDDTEVVVDTDDSDIPREIDWASLWGAQPSQPLPAPEFQVTNFDGTLRTRDWLLGHATVMWFFPLSGTPG